MSERNEELYRLAKEGLNAATSDEQRRHFFKLAEAVLREHAPSEPRKWEGWGVLELRDRGDPINAYGMSSREEAQCWVDSTPSNRRLARITATEVMETE